MTKTLDDFLAEQKLTEQEFITALKSLRQEPKKTLSLDVSSTHVKYGYFADPHIGHKEFKEDLWDRLLHIFQFEQVDFVVCAGDNLEGMSGRPGHIYELTHIGFDQQITYAAQLYNQIPFPIYSIDGNHDGWYFVKNNGGLIVGHELESRVKNYHHLGQDEGRLSIAPGIEILLFHANDGTAYATSYKLQKLIESFPEEQKPSIIHSGHYHKALYIYTRGVHAFESGTLMNQSRFMRGKKIAANMGFGVVDIRYKDGQIESLREEFYPYTPPKGQVFQR